MSTSTLLGVFEERTVFLTPKIKRAPPRAQSLLKPGANGWDKTPRIQDLPLSN